jgi:uncharacterized protein (TIGR03118 family)
MFEFSMRRISPRKVCRGYRRAGASPRNARPRIEALESRLVLSGGPTPYLQTNLVSDIHGLAQISDSGLVNPWGVSFSSTSPFWVSNQGTNTSTLYSVTPTGVSKVPLTVNIPTTASGPQGPTGQVSNNTSSFVLDGMPAHFIFANLNGTISAWNGGTVATVEATTPGGSYSGLAIASSTAGSFLYAANDAQGTIDVFDGKFAPHTLGPNAFVDPDLPSGLVPFNVQFLNGDLYVTYAPPGHASQIAAKPGQGAVAAFTTSGRFLSQLKDSNHLASPWGITLAPAGFGTFSGDLLVGNFAFNDSVINAFDPSTGAFRGTLTDASGHAIENPGLWSLNFGNGVSGGDPNTLYFTAGIDGEMHGLFGSLQAIPPLSPRAPIVPNLPNGAFQTLTTVPANGDVNPYGVAFVPQGFPSGGSLQPGDVLVSNFNNSANQQGTGSTVVDISPNGGESVFFQDSTPSGLTTALSVLKSGFVIVGNVPATYDSKGNLVSVGQGSLRILDSTGKVVTTLSDSQLLDGPWDLTVNDEGSTAQVFVSNVLNGVVTRINLSIPKGGDPIVESLTRIASGYLTRTDPVALVIGPTGLAYDPKSGVLYVASTGDNEVFAVPNAATSTSDAGMGRVVYQDNAHLHGPLGLVLAPNGDLITANGDAVNPDPNQTSELVEFTPGDKFVGQFSIDPAAGAAFGLAATDVGGILRLASVEDSTNSLDVWTFQTGGESSADDGIAGLSPTAPAVLTSTSTGAGTGAGSQSQAGTFTGPTMPQAPSPQPAPVTLMGTTDSSAGASTSSGAPATSGRRKGAHRVAVALGGHDLGSALIGHRHPRGHKSPKGGLTGQATNNPTFSAAY